MEFIKELKDDMGHKFFSMYHNAGQRYLYCKWEGQTVSRDIYAGSTEEMNWAAENAARTQCIAVINDCRVLKGSLAETTEWATNIWSPAMHKSGIKYNAILQSDDIFSQLSLESFEEMTPGPGHIINKIFNNEQAAEEWISGK